MPRQLLLHCSNTVHPWTYAPKKRKAAALDGIIMSARSIWYRSLRSTYPPETGGTPSASQFVYRSAWPIMRHQPGSFEYITCLQNLSSRKIPQIRSLVSLLPKSGRRLRSTALIIKRRSFFVHFGIENVPDEDSIG